MLSDSNSTQRISLSTVGRLGNQIFQYASLYGISRTTGRIPSISGGDKMKYIFNNLTTPFSFNGKANIKLGEKRFAAYDEYLLQKFPSHRHVQIGTFLQSYKYFQKYEDEIRQQF